jgi:hypothetical protein
MFLQFFFIVESILYLTFAYCPTGSIQGNDPTECYLIFSFPTNWVAAEEICVNNGGHLASVANVFQNAFLQNETKTLLYNADSVWIGANSIYKPGNWTWSDNKPFSYKNWAIGYF